MSLPYEGKINGSGSQEVKGNYANQNKGGKKPSASKGGDLRNGKGK